MSEEARYRSAIEMLANTLASGPANQNVHGINVFDGFFVARNLVLPYSHIEPITVLSPERFNRSAGDFEFISFVRLNGLEWCWKTRRKWSGSSESFLAAIEDSARMEGIVLTFYAKEG